MKFTFKDELQFNLHAFLKLVVIIVFQITALSKNKIKNQDKEKQKVQKIMKFKGWPSRNYNT
jgi:hypothetical protein